jgi:hypothetical protein
MQYFMQRRIALVQAQYGAGAGAAFPLVSEKGGGKCEPLTLASLANRALTGGGAWTGEPNPHLKPGAHSFYDVPFEVLDEAENNRRAVIALASRRVEFDVDGKQLPQEVVVPVGQKARAVYVLHGAGYATAHVVAAQYTLVYEDGTESPLDVVTFGASTGQKDPDDALARTSNIQDWSAEYPQFENASARNVMLLNEAAPLDPPVHLYVLEWKNPHPEKVITNIRLKSPGNVDASVLVVAITLAK